MAHPRVCEQAKAHLLAEHEKIDIIEMTLGLQNALAQLATLATNCHRKLPEPVSSGLSGS
jgi:hypothetical protein